MADEKKATTTRGAQTTGGTVDEQTPTPATEKAKGYAPITPDDDTKNPVKVAVPKNAQEIAKEGTALGEAGAEATGGDAPFLEAADATGTRVWAMDADHNINLREKGGPGATAGDVVEFGS